MIHLFERAGVKIALDVGSGAVHVLDDAAYDLLGRLSEEDLKTGKLPLADIEDIIAQYGAAQIEGIFEELCALTAQGLLYEDDSYADFAGELGPAPVKALCLHIAHDCNLRCRYCFASTGGFGGTRKLMDLKTAKASIDLLIKLSDGRKNLEVDFFGGEPLMNFDVIRDTVEYARSIESEYGKCFRFTLTTNGMELDDDKIEYIHSAMNNVVLSLDGRKEVNDAMRPRPDGEGSFDTILPSFQKLAALRTTDNREYYVRGTFTRNNLDFDQDVIALHELGFDQISVEPVVVGEEKSYAIRSDDVLNIERSYERLMHKMIERKTKGQGIFNFFHFMIDLDNGPCAIKRIKGCGCGNEYMAITPDGEIYPCHQFVGDTEFIMGTVTEGITRNDLKQHFAQANLLNKSDCQKCWAKLFCSGGCNANNHSFNGSVYQPHEISCQLEKVRLECAIAIKALT